MNTSGQIPPAPEFHVKLNWKLVLFALLMLPLLIGLGVWQLHRAEDKKTIQESWRRQQAQLPVPFAEIQDLPQSNFRRVSVRGEFDVEHYWLLENQIMDGKLGYGVLMPFRVSDGGQNAGSLLMVNRGWLPADAYRAQLPAVVTPEGPVEVTGSLVQPSNNQFINEPSGQAQGWPRKILEVDLDILAEQLNSLGYEETLHDQLLQIDPDSVAAFAVNWQPTNMSASKHTGYAVQWFSMAFALLVLTVFANSNLAEVLFRR